MEYKSKKNIDSKHICQKTNRHQLNIVNLSFKYPNSNSYVLENINLSFISPTQISIVGRNGAGKTTLVKLLLRFYEPTEGEILLDGINIAKYDYNEYLSVISTVFQDYKLFAFSILENITCFSSEVDLDKYNEVCTDTKINNFISKLPFGDDTFISKEFSNSGKDFSAGELQSIALARSLYKSGSIAMILDEPSSSLDADAEYRLYNYFSKYTKNLLSIFISHRLASCRKSKQILVMDKGKVVEMGNHDELMEQRELYYKLFTSQSKYYSFREEVGK